MNSKDFIFNLFYNFLKTLKVLVLGIDGLEYALVARWNLNVFKQNYHGKIDVEVAVRPGDPLYTPLIWSSFLLGKPAYLFGLDMEKIKQERVKLLYGKLYPLFMLKKRLLGRRNLRLKNFLMKIGLINPNVVVTNLSRIEKLPTNALPHTFVAEAERMGYRVFYKEFPTLRESKYAEMRAMFSKFYNASLEEKLSKLEEVFQYSSELLSETISALENHGLLLYYTSIIDYAHHMLYRPRNLKYMTALYSTYKKLANLISSLVPKSRELCTLIVSDHGFDPVKQEHSKHGFWSTNIKPPKTPKTILDFKNIILELLAL